MPSTSIRLSQIKSRLLIFGSLVSAGAITSATLGTETGIIQSASVSLIQAIAGIGSNIFASDLYSTLAKRLSDSDELLHNHDLTKAVGDSIGVVIRMAAEEAQYESDKKALLRVAHAAPRAWELLSALRDENLAPISESQLPSFFSSDTEDISKLKALEPETWYQVLRWLSKQEDVYVSDETYEGVARLLHTTFPKALREVVKHDFETGGRVYAGLNIMLIGEVVASSKRVLSAIQDLQETNRVQHTEVLVLLERIISTLRPAASPISIQWNLPLRNPFFTGREEVLGNLDTQMRDTRLVALSGLPGAGKTSIAIEYAHRRSKEYQAVFFVKAETQDDLLTGFAALAHPLGLPERDEKDVNKVVMAVKHWLENNSGWLLLLDNADDTSVVRSFIPTGKQGHVLLTTRSSLVGGIVKDVIGVDKMVPHEAALLLLRRAGLLTETEDLTSAGDEDKSAALSIARDVDGLPLAVDQAGAFIRSTPVTPAEYLELYHTAGTALRAEADRDGTYDHISVLTTFSLAFENVVRNNAVAADLLRLCSFLSPDAIPEVILNEGVPELGEYLNEAATQPLVLYKALQETYRYSLLRRDPRARTLSVHRLVQVVLQDNMSMDERRLWGERAIKALARSFPVTTLSNLPDCERLLPHARVCANLVTEWGFEILEAGLLQHNLALYYNFRGQFAEAEQFARRALPIREKCLGESHLDVAETIHILGSVCYYQGRAGEAEPLYLKALAIREATLGKEHPDVGPSLNGLANVYSYQSRFAEAEPLYRRALSLLEKTRGHEHSDVAYVLNNLSIIYFHRGNYKEAEQYLLRSVAIREKTLGTEHPDVAHSLNNLANVLSYQGRYSEAESLFRRALSIWKKAFGDEHPYVATSIGNLAKICNLQGRYSESEPLFQQALAITEKTVGLDYPEAIHLFNGLAKVYALQKRFDEAEGLHRRALSSIEKSLGVEHPYAAFCIQGLAELYRDQGRNGEAELLFQQATLIREKVLGPNHNLLAMTLSSWGVLKQREGDYSQSELLYRRALKILEKNTGSEHPEVASCLHNLAEMFCEKGDYLNAEAHIQRGLVIREKVLGLSHPDTQKSIELKAMIEQQKRSNT